MNCSLADEIFAYREQQADNEFRVAIIQNIRDTVNSRKTVEERTWRDGMYVNKDGSFSKE